MTKPKSGLIPESKVMLATDMYQLTMSRGYRELEKQDEIATFDLFVRKLPKNRSYLVVAGLEQALWYLTEGFNFDDESIDFLKKKKQFRNAKPEFWSYLKDLKFTGDVWAMPEGELAFPNEPMLRLTAPIIEAQVAETYLLSTYNHQTKIASKAARCVEAAQGRAVVEFGTRRTDPGAAIRAARAAYIGGAIGSSNVLADYMFDVPSFGTHAHSWVMSFPNEEEAFEAYFKVYGNETVALIDTYNTIEGAKKAARLPREIKGVRLDSGDMGELSKEVREILNAAGKESGIIFASSDLNEYKINDLIRKGAKIDAFGVGTELILSKDAPALGGVYKLAQLDDKLKLKLSEDREKATLPGTKQVYRIEEGGFINHDVIALDNDVMRGRQLLQKYVSSGRLVKELPDIHKTRDYAAKNLSKLPLSLRKIDAREKYKVKISVNLEGYMKFLSKIYGEIMEGGE